jgi:hypothetical protein
MATDLAERLLPAFNTPTGLPYSRVRSEQNRTSQRRILSSRKMKSSFESV